MSNQNFLAKYVEMHGSYFKFEEGDHSPHYLLSRQLRIKGEPRIDKIYELRYETGPGYGLHFAYEKGESHG